MPITMAITMATTMMMTMRAMTNGNGKWQMTTGNGNGNGNDNGPIFEAYVGWLVNERPTDKKHTRAQNTHKHTHKTRT